jgi:MinD superfamily P-loop ATPase
MNFDSRPTRRGFLAGQFDPMFSGAASFRATSDVEGLSRVVIGERCFARQNQNVVCRSCADACGPQAIWFAPHIGGAALPILTTHACIGCGDRIAACPASAITLANLVEDARV